MEHNTVIFLHIPKAGGSTLNHILDWNYPRTHTISVYDRIPPFIALPDDEKRALQCVKGQIFYGIHQYLPQPATYITIMRHPVDRVVSNNYYNRVRRKRLGEPVNDMSVRQLLKVAPFHATHQLRLLVGGATIENVLHDPLPENAIEIAKQHIEEHFTFAGVLDYYDESLLIMQEKLDWTRAFYARQNINKARKQLDELAPDDLAWLHEQCAAEIELYEWVKARTEAAIAAQGDDFAQRVARLKRSNARFERLWHFASPLHGTRLWTLSKRVVKGVLARR